MQVPTLPEFAREAAGRYVALDGKLWRTLGSLLFRPGLLTREYLAGRRRRFVRPFRLYLGTSLFCFLVAGIALPSAQVSTDATSPGAGDGNPAGQRRGPVPREAGALRGQAERSDRDAVELGFAGLPEALQPAGEIVRERIQRFVRLPDAERMNQIQAGMRRNAPYAMFVLVPAFALLLVFAYPRRRRSLQRPGLYGEHLVFAVHNHAFLFVALTLITLLPGPFAAAFWLWVIAYFVLALRRVYGGSWSGTVARGFALFALYVPLVAIMAGFLLVAAVLLG